MKYSQILLLCVALIASLWAGVPVWLALVAAVAFGGLAAAWMHRRTAEQLQPALAGGYAASVPTPAPGGPGLMGVGLAAAGGVAAGLLAEKLLGDSHAAGGNALIPGSFDADNSAADELARRDVEFGSGDGWGGRDTGLGFEDW